VVIEIPSMMIVTLGFSDNLSKLNACY